MTKKYRVFNHTADLGMEVRGRTRADLFSQAAVALFDLLVERVDAQPGASTQSRSLVIDGDDSTDLFVNFLREILYLFNGEGFVLTECRITHIRQRRLRADIRGCPYDARRHRAKTEIKAVTYHKAAVIRTSKGWQGRVVFDV